MLVFDLWKIEIMRVYYDVEEAKDAVLIRAIGCKVRNRVFIGGEADLP